MAVVAWLTWLCFAWAPEFDEYATMWFSDPSVGLGTLYRERWASETNPPLYYLLIWAVRRLADTSIERLRLVHVPVFAVVIVYLLASFRRHVARQPYLATMAVLYVSSGVCFQFFPYIRSYFLQFSAAVMACAALVLLLDPGGGRRTLNRVVLAAALVLLVNVHFTGALFGAIWAGCALCVVALRRRWDLALFLLAVGVVAALPAVVFVALNFGALSGRAGHFWITTTTSEAVDRMVVVIRGSLSRNLAVLLAIAVAAFVLVRRRRAGLAADPDGMLGIAGSDAIAAALFFAVMGIANWYHPIIIVRYLLVASAPLMSAFSLAAAPALTRYRWLLAAVAVNGAAAVLLAVVRPGEARPQAWADRSIIAGLVESCPTTRLYGLYQDEDTSDLYRAMYAIDGHHAGFPVHPQPTAALWTPALDPGCPTVLWAAHARGREEIRDASSFVDSFRVQLEPAVARRARLRITPSVGLLLLLPPGA